MIGILCLPMRKLKEIGGRKHERIDFRRPAFVVLKPKGPWLECNRYFKRRRASRGRCTADFEVISLNPDAKR